MDSDRPLDKLSEDDLAYYRDMVADADEVIIATDVQVCDFTEEHILGGKKIRYFGTEKSWKKWCIENGVPLVN